MNSKALYHLFVVILPLVLLAMPLSAQVPSLINYQGRLTDAQGNPVTGNRTMVVKVYNSLSGGNLTYQESIGSVFVLNGTYSFAFGSTGNGVATVLTGQDYLSLSVNGTEESSRTRLLAVPFAMRSMESTDTKNLRNDLVNLGVLPSPSGSPSRVIGLSGNLVFGNVAIGQTVNRTLGISNTGNGNLTISSLICPSGFGATWSGVVAPGATRNVTVAFSPTSQGFYGGDITVLSNANAGNGTIPVNGAGVFGGIISGNFITVTGGPMPSGSPVAVTFVETFQIALYELTWQEWLDVRGWGATNGYSDLANVGGGNGANHPVHSVSWYDALKWCNAKSEKDGLTPVYQVNGLIYRSGQSFATINPAANGYRLPTEAEWQYAARGGLSSKNYTYSGSNDVNQVAWYAGNSIGGTNQVGLKMSNELGISDMSGNVSEWLFDPSGSSRRYSGGGWDGEAWQSGLGTRGSASAHGTSTSRGFRVARNGQ